MKKGWNWHRGPVVRVVRLAGIALCLVAGRAEASFALQPDPETVYAPPAPPTEFEGLNEGGVNLDVRVSYVSDYIFRGVRRFERIPGARTSGDYQFDGLLRFDLAHLPHPFIGVFTNVSRRDEISNFQEIRPYLGVDWHLRPLTLSAGHNGYLFPERDELNTTEIWGRISLDDSFLLLTERPIFSPYLYAAYDYRLYNGWYIEGGIEHAWPIEGMPLTFVFQASVAYVRGIELFEGVEGHDRGFHHYQLGLEAHYTVNTLLNIPRRYGQWDVVGFIHYTDPINRRLRADRELWGGVGIGFRY